MWKKEKKKKRNLRHCPVTLSLVLFSKLENYEMDSAADGLLCSYYCWLAWKLIFFKKSTETNKKLLLMFFPFLFPTKPILL